MSLVPRPPTTPLPEGADRLTTLCEEISDISVSELRAMASTLNLNVKSTATKQTLCDAISAHINIHNVEVRTAEGTDELEEFEWLLDPITYHWLVTAVNASDGRLYNLSTFNDIMAGRVRATQPGISPYTKERLKRDPPACLPVRSFVLGLLAKKGIEEVAEAYVDDRADADEDVVAVTEEEPATHNPEYQHVLSNYQAKRAYPDRAGLFDLAHKNMVVKPLRDENPLLYDLVDKCHLTVYRGIDGARTVTALRSDLEPYLFAWMGKDNTANVGVNFSGGGVAFARYMRDGKRVQLLQDSGSIVFGDLQAFVQHARA
jgi:hypothetical protein